MPGGLLGTGCASGVFLLPAVLKGYGVHSTINIRLCLMLFGVSIAWPGSGHISIPLVRGDTIVLCFWILCDRGLGSSKELRDNSKPLPWEVFRISEVSIDCHSLYWDIGNLLDSWDFVGRNEVGYRRSWCKAKRSRANSSAHPTQLILATAS